MLRDIFSGRHRRDDPVMPSAVSFTDWAKMYQPGAGVNFGGGRAASFKMNSGATSPAAGFYDSNSVVFACEANRILLFSEARFQFQPFNQGRPGKLFGSKTLLPLEHPWLNGSTRDLLTQMELDVGQSGNSYWIFDDNDQFVRVGAERVTIVTEAVGDPVYGLTVGERLNGYAIEVLDKTGRSGRTVMYAPDEVVHYAPIPDGRNRFRGVSWMSPCLSDIESDVAMTDLKQSQVSNGAQLGYVVSLDPSVTEEQFDKFVEIMDRQHNGAQNAGKTLYLAGGADVKTVGQSFEQLAYKATQGAGETRIAACAGVPPVIVGLSEGLSSATYSNYSQARRRLVDGTMRPLWGAVAGALETLVVPPAACRLWYDDRDIPFLREDVLDQAEIRKANAATIASLINAGYKPDTVREAVIGDDFSVLEHTGLFSVQLQPPQPSGPPSPPPIPATVAPKPIAPMLNPPK